MFCAEVLPADKARYVADLRREGHVVLMVGDGINDSPALSEADAGIAISDGAAIAREIADITIAAESLWELVKLRRIAMALMERIRSNYRFVIGFNGTLIGLGLAGYFVSCGIGCTAQSCHTWRQPAEYERSDRNQTG
ncbi:ATPase, P-type, K/Mg/Cd/Cu/Zn/Na/Ca/Na/H-transporter [human gut metagenome]|uniref:ATPase, P-type, K/Mg/Cd/Cu/Zn/Na/Ca/Na/H-transporter n=1 Tax=human gut metagenome TaxID=408170 RepID=K1RZH5_9ZZZZ